MTSDFPKDGEEPRWIASSEELPAAGEEVLCRNEKVQALGYIDKHHQWHFEDGTLFPGVALWQRLTRPSDIPARGSWCCVLL